MEVETKEIEEVIPFNKSYMPAELGGKSEPENVMNALRKAYNDKIATLLFSDKFKQMISILDIYYKGRYDIKIVTDTLSNIVVSDDVSLETQLRRLNMKFNECQILRVGLHYPEMTISNSNGQQHKIYDFYVFLYFKYDLKLKTYSYTRTTFTDAEALTGYSFSHVSRFSSLPINIGPNHFCFGDGPLSRLNQELYSEFNPVYFRALCIELKRYLSWESLEGGPFIKMSDIHKAIDINCPKKISIFSDNTYFYYRHEDGHNIRELSSSEVERLAIKPRDITKLLFYSGYIKYSRTQVNGLTKITCYMSEEDELAFVNDLINKIDMDFAVNERQNSLNKLFAKRLSTGEFVKMYNTGYLNGNSILAHDGRPASFRFKGKVKTIKIIKTKDDEDINSNTWLNPHYKSRVFEGFSTILTDKYIKTKTRKEIDNGCKNTAIYLTKAESPV